MRSKQLATLILSALSLLHSTSGGTIRRKRRYVIVHGEEDGDTDLPWQNGPGRSNRKDAKSSSEIDTGSSNRLLKQARGKRSKTGNFLNDNDDLNDIGDDEGVSAPQQESNNFGNLDWDAMTDEELEYYFFEIQTSKSYPESPAPMAPVSPSAPSQPVPTPTMSAVPSPTKRPTPAPTAKGPATSKPTPAPTKIATPRPTKIATPMPVGQPTLRPTKKPTPQPTLVATPRPTVQPTRLPTVEPTSAPVPPTPAPVAECEDLPRRDALLRVVGDVTEDESVLTDPNTPQGQAVAWLLEEDPAQIDPCTYPTPEQRYILATFYFATGGSSWEGANGWMSEDGECIWFGINCNGSGGVTRLELRENNLIGALPEELGSMSFLRRFDVSGNSLAGQLVPLPPTLVFLDVEGNSMGGSPFESVLALNNIRQLRISSNSFGGTIPTEMGTLENLEELWMANNQFNGATIPTEIGNLQNLETLFIYAAQIGGNLPSELGRLDLTEFLANNNQFRSSVPEELFANTRLTLLRLDSNELTGSISSSVGNLVDLTDLFLSNNNLIGTVPVQILRLTSMVNLLMNDNLLSGTIRDGFEDFRDLDFVDFSANQLTGTLPSSFFGIRDLRFLYLSNNMLGGSIPSTWGNAVLLRDLFLDNNFLSGEVPELPQGAFTRLTELLLNGNNLSGAMPGSVCQLRTSAILEDLWADCAGTPPEIQCALPSCCTFCFE